MECGIQNSKTDLKTCTYPFEYISTTHDGFYQSCPVSQKTEYSVHTLTPEEYFSGSYASSLRQDLLLKKNTTKVERNCEYCLSLEKKGLKSFRKPIVKDQEVSLKYLIINHIGNKCNLKCLGCSPERSSGYGPLIDNWDKKSFELKNLKELVYISLLGGEPFLMKSTEEILQSMPDQCKISITTNGLVYPQYLKNFNSKKIKILISIDGINELDDYIRTGSNFDRKKRIIKKFIDTFESVHFLCTFNIVNYKYLSDIKDFLNTEYNYDLKIVNRMFEPTFFDAVNLPISIKKNYNKKFDNDFINKEPDEKLLRKGIGVLKKYDKTQKSNFLDYYPELYDLYNSVEEQEYVSLWNESPIPPIMEYRV